MNNFGSGSRLSILSEFYLAASSGFLFYQKNRTLYPSLALYLGLGHLSPV